MGQRDVPRVCWVSELRSDSRRGLLRFEAGRGELIFENYGMRRAFVGSDGTVSIVKIVSLSLLVSKN